MKSAASALLGQGGRGRAPHRAIFIRLLDQLDASRGAQITHVAIDLSAFYARAVRLDCPGLSVISWSQSQVRASGLGSE